MQEVTAAMRMLRFIVILELIALGSISAPTPEKMAQNDADNAEYRYGGRSNNDRHIYNKHNHNSGSPGGYYSYQHHYGPGKDIKDRRQIDVVCLESARNTSFDPMCSSDGQTFQNYLAYLCYVRFFNAPRLTVRRGACAAYPEPDYCKFSFVVWRQVCGMDNATYSSPWELMCNVQRTRKPNHVLYDGPCRLRCPMSLMYDPVCGSDGVDYPNSEALSCAALRDSTLVAVKRGPCRAQEAGVSCKRMVQRHGGGETPVCASNGVTYANHEAVLCLREFNPGLRIRHDGPCRLLDVDMRPLDPVRVCHTADYTPLWLPVCATDGHTYSNPFVLVCAQARKIMASDVTIRHAGECDRNGGDGEGREEDNSNEDACRRAAEMPALIDRPLFCASDGRTYYNHRHYACAVQRDGDWFQYRIVRLNMPCDAADHPCERLRLVPDALHVDPICGSDGLTYASPLALMCAMANRKGLIRHHRGPCLTSNEEDHGEHQQTTTDVAVNNPGGGGDGDGDGDESDYEYEDTDKDENKGGQSSSAGDENTDKPNTETKDTTDKNTETDEDVEEIDVDNVTPRRTVVMASLTIK